MLSGVVLVSSLHGLNRVRSKRHTCSSHSGDAILPSAQSPDSVAGDQYSARDLCRVASDRTWAESRVGRRALTVGRNSTLSIGEGAVIDGNIMIGDGCTDAILLCPGITIPDRLVSMSFRDVLGMVVGPFFSSGIVVLSVCGFGLLLAGALADLPRLILQVALCVFIYGAFVAGMRLPAWLEVIAEQASTLPRCVANRVRNRKS